MIRCSAMRHSLLFALLLLLPACKKGFGANFEGEITMRTTRAGTTSDMVVKAKGDKLRFESNARGKTASAIFDPQQNRVVALMDDQKAYMDMDFSSPAAAPNTDPRTSAAEKTGKKETIAG